MSTDLPVRPGARDECLAPAVLHDHPDEDGAEGGEDGRSKRDRTRPEAEADDLAADP